MARTGLAGTLARNTRQERGAVLSNEAQIAVVILVRFPAGKKLRALQALTLGRFWLKSVDGLVFSRTLGSGAAGGFGPAPGLLNLGYFGTFRTKEQAAAFVSQSSYSKYLVAHGAEVFACVMQATALKGAWGGVAPCAVTCPAEVRGPIAAITRATLRPSRAARFWRHAAPSQSQLETCDGCLLAAGLGEAPFIRQATFTIWRDLEAMSAYSATGAHGAAARAARLEGYFSESMFARFQILYTRGTWRGFALPAFDAPIAMDR